MPSPQYPNQDPNRSNPTQPDTPVEEPLRQNPQKEEQNPQAQSQDKSSPCGC